MNAITIRITNYLACLYIRSASELNWNTGQIIILDRRWNRQLLSLLIRPQNNNRVWIGRQPRLKSSGSQPGRSSIQCIKVRITWIRSVRDQNDNLSGNPWTGKERAKACGIPGLSSLISTSKSCKRASCFECNIGKRTLLNLTNRNSKNNKKIHY